MDITTSGITSLDLMQLDLGQWIVLVGAVAGIVVVGLLAIVPSALDLDLHLRGHHTP